MSSHNIGYNEKKNDEKYLNYHQISSNTLSLLLINQKYLYSEGIFCYSLQENLSIRLQTRSNTNQPAQLHNIASVGIWIEKWKRQYKTLCVLKIGVFR